MLNTFQLRHVDCNADCTCHPVPLFCCLNHSHICFNVQPRLRSCSAYLVLNPTDDRLVLRSAVTSLPSMSLLAKGPSISRCLPHKPITEVSWSDSSLRPVQDIRLSCWDSWRERQVNKLPSGLHPPSPEQPEQIVSQRILSGPLPSRL